MKKNIFSYILFSLIIFVSGCSSDISLEPENKEETGSSILRLEINKEMLTRGMITSTTFQEGDELLVRLIDTHFDSWGIPMLNCKATYTNGVWELDTLIDVSKPYQSYNGSSDFPDFFSVEVAYPYDKVSLPTKGLGSRFSCDDVLSQTDILRGWCTVEKKDPVAKVTCFHYLTCLSFDAKNDTDRPIMVDSLTVTQKMMKYGNTYFNFLPQSVQIGADPMEYEELNVYDNYREKVTCPYHIEIMPGEKKSINFMLNPTNYIYKYYDWRNEFDKITLEPLKFELSVNGNPVRFDIQPSSWNSCQNYVYPITISEPKSPYIGEIGGHEYVDMGGSVLWASCNLGAENPYESGLFYQWGDLTGYDASSDFWSNIRDNYIYNNWTLSELRDAGIIIYENNGYVLNPQTADAANHAWGNGWRMPTETELKELVDDCTHSWDEQKKGTIFHSNKTGEELFLPAGWISGGTVSYSFGYYWTTNIDLNWYNNYGMIEARHMYCTVKDCYFGPVVLYNGCLIRPVITKE